MKSSLISVIIPVYNVEEYIKECIDSVLDQTYKNLEIIVINDGSTDNSYEKLKKYSIYNNVKILSQENQGQSVARNRGIKISKGQYIYFLDADDYILPETLEDLVTTLEKNDLDIVRFAAEPFVDNFNKNINVKRYDFSDYFAENKKYNKKDFLKLNLEAFSASPVLYLMKKELLKNSNITFKSHIVHEDELFTLEVFLNTKSMMYSSNFYYKRRYRKNSTMTSKSKESRKKSFDSKCIVLDELNNLLLKYTDKYEVKLINKRIRSVTAQLINNYDDIDNKFKKNRMKNIRNLSIKYYFYYKIKKIARKIIY